MGPNGGGLEILHSGGRGLTTSVRATRFCQVSALHYAYVTCEVLNGREALNHKSLKPQN